MKQQNGFIDPAAVVVVGGVILLGALIFIGGPQYNVWQQSLAGKAELQKAEFTRQVKVLEAKALKDAAVLQAEAEVERAKGASAANKILGESLKGNPEYLTYLYIQNLENADNSKEKTVIYVPTEKGIPIPITESQRLKQN
jgi:regulator of protease activity HflC (stomatin/prohibitin superfamily)